MYKKNEIMDENFPNLMKNMNLQILEFQGTSSKKIKDIHIKTHYSQVVKKQRQR